MDSRSRSKNKKKYKYKCPIPKSTFTSFMDEGNMHFRAGHYRKALYCFDRALELKNKNKPALVARSECYLKLGDAASALKDAEASFDEDNTYIQGLFQYAESLFNLGQFEQALIAFHRGFRCRRDKEEFRVGINKSQEAIRRAIGDRQATQIEDLDTILPKIDEMEALLAGNTDHCCILATDREQEWKKRQATSFTKKRGSIARSRWVDREILGVMQQDKDYLAKFLKRPDIAGNQQAGSGLLRGKAKEALNYIEIREHFWRQQNPMYARKVGLNFNNDMVLQYEKQEMERMEACRKIKMDAAQGAVLKNIAQIEHALKIGRPKDCQLECERAIRQIKEITNRLLPRKAEFLTEILQHKGLALMKLKEFEHAATTFQEEFDIANEQKMFDAKARALDYLGRAHAMRGAFTEAAEVWDSRLALAKTGLERAYLFHEIARCYYETNKFDLSKYYGLQALEEAMKLDDVIWGLYSAILMGQVEIKLKQFEKAALFFSKAEEYAVRLGNKVTIDLLREADQCIKIWMEKKDTFQLETSSKRNSDMDSNDSSDSSLGDPLRE